jgi:hypothetical protein
MQATQAPFGTRYSSAKAGEQISVSDLLPGDVLLSCGKEALSILIKRLDGGDYSHSAVWDGPSAVDATEDGFVRRELEKDIGYQWYLDAYRWHSPAPGSTDLGAGSYPYGPVIARNDRIVDAKTKFAYDELLMLAVIVAVSKEPSDKWLGRAVRLLLSRAEQWIHEHIFAKPGTAAMTCAESVAVSFDEAVPAKYAIELEVDQSKEYDTIAAARSRESGGGIMRAFSSYDEVKRRYAELIVTAAPATARGLHAAIDARTDVRMNLPPGCVTPHDLQTSPSLRKLGRLSPWKPRPPADSEPSWRLFIEAIKEFTHKQKTLSRQ